MQGDFTVGEESAGYGRAVEFLESGDTLSKR